MTSDGDKTPLANTQFLDSLGSYRGESKRGGLDTLPDVPVGVFETCKAAHAPSYCQSYLPT